MTTLKSSYYYEETTVSNMALVTFCTDTVKKGKFIYKIFNQLKYMQLVLDTTQLD